MFSLSEITSEDDDPEDDEPFLDSTGCNKMIMIVTDGATETALNVFQTRNWHPDNISNCHQIEVVKNSHLKYFIETNLLVI